MRNLSRQVPQKWATVLRQEPATEKRPKQTKRQRGMLSVLSLSGSEMIFLARCLLVVTAVRLGLTLLSYNRVRSLVTRLEARQCASMGELRRVAWGVAAAARTLRIVTRRTGDGKIDVRVQDHGAGIAEPERIFEAFYTTKKEGLGMGLAICRSIIEAHGGRISAESELGGGASVGFTLPLHAANVVESVA